MAGKGRQIIKVAGINLLVLASLVLVAELLCRAYEGLSKTSNYQSEQERQLAQKGEQCITPPIVTEDGELSRYASDFSCAGTTIKDGLRFTVAQPVGARATLHVYGGSTVFGTGSNDAGTIPSQLQKLINRDHADIRVDNHGFMTLVAAQQLAALKNSQVKPGDLVLFYDGGNDAFNSYVYKSPEGTIIGYNRKNKLAYALIQVRHALQLHSALYRQLGAAKAAVSGKNDPSRVNCVAVPSDAEQSRYIDHYFSVLTQAREYAKARGARFVHVLQPVLGSSNGPMPVESKVYRDLLAVDGISTCTHAGVLSYYRKLADRYKQRKHDFNGLNLASLFEGSALRPQDRYIDWIHMTPEANRVVSERIHQHLKLQSPRLKEDY